MSPPVSWNPRDKVLILPVKLTGSLGEKWTQTVLDTGATYSMFPPAVLTAIGCTPDLALKPVKIITASSVEYVPMMRIPSIEVFGETIENITVVSHLLPPGTPAQGLIGIDLLRHFDLHLEFSAMRLGVIRN
jgi:predicted aspartyl protease